MHRILTTFVIFLICFLSASAHDRKFSFSAIPPQLLENSNSVIRMRETTIDIKSAGKAVMTVAYAVTILKENAVENAILFLGYNKFTSIRNLNGYVYDKNGEKVERIEREKFLDYSAISYFSTYEDNRMIFCKPKCQTVPFTVEYNYEIVYNGILDYPDFYLVNDFNVAVEQARLTVSAPDTIGLRYFPRNIEVTCYFEQLPSGKTYSWFFSNIPSFRKEPFSPPITEISPSVLLAPGSFKLKDKWGNAISWNSFGSWVYELLNGRAELGEETRQKVNNLTSGVSDTLKKIQILYQYLQDKTRYTSIQIGLGGWQPIMASEVDRLGYGDCKALTNYMLALLKAAGVNSYYTLVNSGENEPEIITAFPSQQFDHVILCVPLKNDSLWLECTSQDIPMGYLGTFTDDRSVLLIKEEGGFICHTPVYNQKVNIQSRVSHVQLQENGSAVMTVKTISRGLFYDKVSKIMHSDETDKRKKITERIPITNSTLKSFDLKEDKAFPPGIEETLNLTIQKIGVAAGDLTLVVPNQMTREDELSTQVIIKRKNPVEIRRSTLKTDTTYYTLPDELTFTGNHINETITSTFGEYRAVTSLKGQTIQYIRNLVVYKGVYQPELYEDFLGFFEKIAKADAKKLALKPAR